MTLDELQAICDAATPGDWERQKYGTIKVEGNWVIDAKREEDFDFVLAAREYMPKLLELAFMVKIMIINKKADQLRPEFIRAFEEYMREWE